jgi:hypothetical protein
MSEVPDSLDLRQINLRSLENSKNRLDMRLGVFHVTAEFVTNQTGMLPLASQVVAKCGRQPVKFPYSRSK